MTARPIRPISPLEVDRQLSTNVVEHSDTYVGADMVNNMKGDDRDDGGMRKRKSDQSLKSVISEKCGPSRRMWIPFHHRALNRSSPNNRQPGQTPDSESVCRNEMTMAQRVFRVFKRLPFCN
jgi:hypothetical protein